MSKYLNIGVDIETIPTQCGFRIQEIKTAAEAMNHSPPSGYTKADFGADLELEPSMVKGMELAGLKAMWLDRKLAELVEKEFQSRYRKTSFSAGAGGEVVSTSLKIFGYGPNGVPHMTDPVTLHRYRGQEDCNEVDILTRVVKWIDSVSDYAGNMNLKPRFVGANVLGFDFRFMIQRCMMLGVKPPKMDMTSSKYSRDKYFDVLDVWSFGDQTQRPSLDALCKILNIETPKGDEIGPIHGGMVWDIWANDGQEGAQRIANYNSRDVVVLEPIFEIVSQIEGY